MPSDSGARKKSAAGNPPITAAMATTAPSGRSQSSTGSRKATHEGLSALKAEGCDAVYAPALSTLLPAEFYTDIHLDDLTGALSGKDDPALFDSYIRGMSRLLNQAASRALRPAAGAQSGRSLEQTT